MLSDLEFQKRESCSSVGQKVTRCTKIRMAGMSLATSAEGGTGGTGGANKAKASSAQQVADSSLKRKRGLFSKDCKSRTYTLSCMTKVRGFDTL